MSKITNAQAQQVGRSGGAGFGTLLTILFIGLKLGGVIAWSWWWVLAPLWIPLALLLLVLAIGGAVAVLTSK